MSDIFTSFKLDSTNSECNYWIAEEIKKSKDLNNAISYYTRAIKYDGKREQFYRSRGYCYANLGMFLEAIKDYKVSNRLLKKHSDHVMKKRLKESNYRTMSWCYAKTNNIKDAIITIEKAIKSNPTNIISQLYYATYLTLEDTTNTRRSLNIYNNLIQKNPDLGLAHLFIGNIYSLEGNQKLAEEYYMNAMLIGIEVSEKTKNIKNQVDLIR